MSNFNPIFARRVLAGTKGDTGPQGPVGATGPSMTYVSALPASPDAGTLYAVNMPDSRCLALLHLNGTNGSTTITDSSPAPKTWYVSGDARLSTTSPKFGTACLILDGSGDAIHSQDSIPAINDNDFTIAFFIKPVSGGAGNVYGRIVQIGNNSTNGGLFLVRNNNPDPLTLLLQLYGPSGYLTLFAPSTSIPNNSWTHVMLTRAGGVYRLYFDGNFIAKATATGNRAHTISQSNYSIGSNSADSESFNGYLDEILIMNGIALCTGEASPSFSVPAGEYSPTRKQLFYGAIPF